MAVYNPLQAFSPLNMRFDQAGQMAGQIADRNLQNEQRANQERQQGLQRAGAQKFIGLQGLMNSGALEGDEDALNIARQGMQEASLSALGSPEKYMNFQMKQQQMAARNKKEQALSDPKVQELMNIQKNASLGAKGLVSKYLNTDSLDEKQAIEKEYLELSKVSNEAGAELGANPNISGWQYTPMPNFFRMVEGAVKGRGTQDLAGIEKETKEARRDLVRAESDAIKGRLDLSRQMQTENLAKLKEDRGRTAHNQITKVLKDSGLSEPSAYDSIIRDAQFAVEKKNIFTAVKVLSNVIEPGLSVTEGEVEGYTVGGTSNFNKFLQKMGGAGESDMNRILELLTGIANNRKTQAQKIISNQGRRVQSSSSSAPQVTDLDPLGLGIL